MRNVAIAVFVGFLLLSCAEAEKDLSRHQVENFVILQFDAVEMVIGQKINFAKQVEVYPSYMMIGDSLQDVRR